MSSFALSSKSAVSSVRNDACSCLGSLPLSKLYCIVSAEQRKKVAAMVAALARPMHWPCSKLWSMHARHTASGVSRNATVHCPSDLKLSRIVACVHLSITSWTGVAAGTGELLPSTAISPSTSLVGDGSAANARSPCSCASVCGSDAEIDLWSVGWLRSHSTCSTKSSARVT